MWYLEPVLCRKSTLLCVQYKLQWSFTQVKKNDTLCTIPMVNCCFTFKDSQSWQFLESPANSYGRLWDHNVKQFKG